MKKATGRLTDADRFFIPNERKDSHLLAKMVAEMREAAVCAEVIR